MNKIKIPYARIFFIEPIKKKSKKKTKLKRKKKK